MIFSFQGPDVQVFEMMSTFSHAAGSEKESQPEEAATFCEAVGIVAESFLLCMRNFPVAQGGDPMANDRWLNVI
jgi:hypothetical protein